jgi:hypothetical protein
MGTVNLEEAPRSFVGVFLCAVAVGGVVSSCGGDHAAPERDGGDVGGDAEGGVTCLPPADAVAPDGPAVVSFDGGVPLDQVLLALAGARCSYWSRCSPLAAYVVADCIDALRQTGAWHLTDCTGEACVTETITFPFPSTALLQAVDAGVVKYDPYRESACVQTLQAQACHGSSLWEAVPACVGVFTCAADAGGDGSSVDGGPAADGGSGCSALDLGPRAANRLPCATAGDCADAGPPGGPNCVAGYCAPRPCGDSLVGCSFVEVGQPCDSDPPLLGASLPATPWATMPTKICSPGLSCAGLDPDGGLGACAARQDIGRPCALGAALPGCAFGLTCECGTCRIAPGGGSCAPGASPCRVGTAYCDLGSNTCIPVKSVGGDCGANSKACASDLMCDTLSSTCERPSH